jgi:ATP-dependent Lhr-like helicase
VPAAFLGPAAGALDGLLSRYARTHGPFLTPDPARRWGLPVGVVTDALERLLAAGTLLRGEFRPGGAEREWCDPEVLRLLRRRSLARLRREVEPVDPAALARFLPDWQGVAAFGQVRPPLRSTGALERLAEVVDQLAGLPIPASVLERDVLPARIPGYQPRLLDELGALGEVAWVGRGSLGRDDGRIALVRPGRAILRPVGSPDDSSHRPSRATSRSGSTSRPRRLVLSRAVHRGTRTSDEVPTRCGTGVGGEVTNDTFAPLRALRWKRSGSGPAPGRSEGG